MPRYVTSEYLVLRNSGEDILDKDESLDRILSAKKLRREELSMLPFKQKIEILVQLQEMARGIKRHGSKKKSHVWII